MRSSLHSFVHICIHHVSACSSVTALITSTGRPDGPQRGWSFVVEIPAVKTDCACRTTVTICSNYAYGHWGNLLLSQQRTNVKAQPDIQTQSTKKRDNNNYAAWTDGWIVLESSWSARPPRRKRRKVKSLSLLTACSSSNLLSMQTGMPHRLHSKLQ